MKKKYLNINWKIFFYDDSGEWNWLSRIIILGLFAGLGGLVGWLVLAKIADCLLFKFDVLKGNDIFAGALALAAFVFINGIGIWLIRTHDTKKQFRDTFQQQNQTLFSNALNLLFQKDNIIANSVGLKELFKLRNTENKEDIDRITSSGLNLKKAKLKEADLQGAYLQDADLKEAELIIAKLEGADLEGADLEDANLQGADLQGANLYCIKWNDNTKLGVQYNKKTLNSIINDNPLKEKIRKKGNKID